jgi:transposase
MTPLVLTVKEHAALEAALHATHDARLWRRLRALLWLAEGLSPGEVARRLETSLQSLWNWRMAYLAHRTPEQLADHPPPGRSPALRETVQQILAATLEASPDSFGYRATGWTVPLLQVHLREQHQIEASDSTLRRGLHALGYRWKRPRYVLSRRDPERERKKNGAPRARLGAARAHRGALRG